MILKSQKKLSHLKKVNFWQFTKQLIKDNKAYQNYIKTEAIENKKLNKAILNINLGEEQSRKAKNLQLKTFETFNEIDEMSQKYSESVEAMGEIVQNTLGSTIKTLCGLIASTIAFKPLLKGDYKNMNYTKVLTTNMLGILLGTIPSILLSIYTTQEQKKASRIANMLATKNLTNISQNIASEAKQKSCIGAYNDFIKISN